MIRKLLLISLISVGSLGAELRTSVHNPVIYRPAGRVYTAALSAEKDNDFTVAMSTRGSKVFEGITPEKVSLNGKKIDGKMEEVPNPLRGAKVDHLVMMSQRPLVSVGNRLYLVDERVKPISVHESPKIKDALGNESSSLLALTSTAAEVPFDLDAGASFAAIMAVPNKKGGFDGNGSGIAVSFFKSIYDKQTKKSFMAWDAIDAGSGVSSFDGNGQQSNKGNKALSLGKDTSVVYIDTPVNSIGKAVDLHFDRDLGRLYIALQVDAEVGARALVVASLERGRLMFQKIAPDSVFSEVSSIVGQKKSGPIGITKVRTMQTRTHVRYVVVVDTDNGVYALPLVDNHYSSSFGALANVTEPPLEMFTREYPHKFEGRVFASEATQPEHLYTKSSVEACVGGKGSLPGTVSDIAVSNEAVIVSTVEGGNNPERVAQGIFYSQPVFDKYGRIGSWTDWQRVAADQPVKGFVYDVHAGKHWYIPVAKDKMVLQTSWTNGSDKFDAFISSTFAKSKGGVHGLFDFPYSTDGFSQRDGSRLSVQLFTGNGVIALVQTGADSGGLFRPGIDTSSVCRAAKGKLDGFTKASTIIMSGLEELGPITSAAVITDSINGWFVVGGVGGIAILADKEGRGWRKARGLGKEFEGLTTKHEWKIIRATKNIRKLVVQDGQLFALTPRVVERVMVSQEAVAAGEVPATTIAQITQNQAREAKSFSDLYVKGPVGILATSYGLLRTTTDVRRTEKHTEWKRIPLPEAAGSPGTGSPGTGSPGNEPVSRLFGIRALQDNIYLLNGHVSLGQTFVYRMVIRNDREITDDTVTVFSDFFTAGEKPYIALFPHVFGERTRASTLFFYFFLKTKKSFFLDLGNYHNYLVTDGSFMAVSRSAFGKDPASLLMLPPSIKSSDRIGGQTITYFLPKIPNAGTMGPLVRNSASGAWMATGDFGVRQLKGNNS